MERFSAFVQFSDLTFRKTHSVTLMQVIASHHLKSFTLGLIDPVCNNGGGDVTDGRITD